MRARTYFSAQQPRCRKSHGRPEGPDLGRWGQIWVQKTHASGLALGKGHALSDGREPVARETVQRLVADISIQATSSARNLGSASREGLPGEASPNRNRRKQDGTGGLSRQVAVSSQK
ncbi:hypothetical protein ACCO45_000988 [Purpureocillium lilacinum]|uniref:Uncharacterized protein n=1 Tax=Purpureocillium lilacinum TaxID=33203 RepID=A0ACC4E765_PURLI